MRRQSEKLGALLNTKKWEMGNKDLKKEEKRDTIKKRKKAIA